MEEIEVVLAAAVVVKVVATMKVTMGEVVGEGDVAVEAAEATEEVEVEVTTGMAGGEAGTTTITGMAPEAGVVIIVGTMEEVDMDVGAEEEETFATSKKGHRAQIAAREGTMQMNVAVIRRVNSRIRIRTKTRDKPAARIAFRIKTRTRTGQRSLSFASIAA